MDRVRSISHSVLEEHRSKFGEDYADNKRALDQVSVIRSKGLKNKIAGYITKFIKKEIREENAKKIQAEAASRPDDVDAPAAPAPEAAGEAEGREAPVAGGGVDSLDWEGRSEDDDGDGSHGGHDAGGAPGQPAGGDTGTGAA